ncbi:hypothetical protein ACRRTK_021585 [Alexandromys fortis]
MPSCSQSFVHLASEEIIESKAQEEEPSSLLKYFSVVWCKASKKKHKKWEGDAILIVKGRSFTLKDLEGKDIGRGANELPLSWRSSEIQQFVMVPGPQCEVTEIVKAVTQERLSCRTQR